MNFRKFILKTFFLSGLILLCFQTTAQESVQVKWRRMVEVNTKEDRIRVPAFVGAEYDRETGVPYLNLKVPGRVGRFSFEQTNFTPADENEQKQLAILPVKNINPEITHIIDRGQPFSIIRFAPFRRNNGRFEKLTSFTYTTEKESTPARTLGGVEEPSSKRVAAQPSSSVLSSGSWYKISIAKSGIHKIDYSLLKEIGIDPDETDPGQIKIFGNGGQMLPQKISDFRHNDLKENRIFVQGEQDGTFNREDYILFYGAGPDRWTYNSDAERFDHITNLYSDKAYYYITVSEGAGKRVTDISVPSGEAVTINSFDDHFVHELESVNILTSGRQWFGEKFNSFENSHTVNFSCPGLDPAGSVKIRSSVMASSDVNTSFSLYLNNNLIGSQAVTGISKFTDVYSLKGKLNQKEFIISGADVGSTSRLSFTYNYDASGKAVSTGYLDFIEVNIKRKLALYENETRFRSAEILDNTGEFVVKNINSACRIWDVTDHTNARSVPFHISGSEGRFKAKGDSLREFVVFKGSSFTAPIPEGSVSNQNLHAITTPPDLLIITHQSLMSEANRLADFKERFHGISTEVVQVGKIYNEFSSGTPDISGVRDFIKMVYDRNTSADSLKWVLLFGDCSYDYKNRIDNNTNMVPVYESPESLDPVLTYSSDDYFGFMESHEGDWKINHSLELGIGRIPASTVEDARIVVDKIIHYTESPETMGKWRNNISLVADDEDWNNYQNYAEELSGIITSRRPEFNISKIYVDAYQQISTPGGERVPDGKQDLNEEIEQGNLLVNYIGHGGETGWTQEHILETRDITNWTNYDKLSFFVTATCEFGRYDDPEIKSGAELALFNPDGGAIGLMTTTRPVLATSNETINTALYKYIFTPLPNGKMPSLGTVMIGTKDDSHSHTRNRNYSLLGDPSLVLAFPTQEALVTHINGSPADSEPDTLKALSKVTVRGEVRNQGSIQEDYNGEIRITVFDKKSEVTTYGNGSSPITFGMQKNIIFDGPATVKAGTFEFTFILPKDISYQYGQGKISLYSKKDNSLLDATGQLSSIVIGGTADSIADDNTPPEVKLYLNDKTFVDGGLTGPDPLFIGSIKDENGINITSTGIGHELALYIDESEKATILNEYYTANLDDYREGSVEYPLKELEPGNHSLRLKAWDTYNNSAEGYIEFVVANNEDLALRNVLNYPNPFSTNTEFHFDHNRAGDDIRVLVKIFTISGKLIKTIDRYLPVSESHISSINWNGTDDFGDKIGKGVYVYKVEVLSVRDGSRNHKFQKLVILN